MNNIYVSYHEVLKKIDRVLFKKINNYFSFMHGRSTIKEHIYDIYSF
jgi:hypothetical protein